MDRNTILAFILIGLILIIFAYLQPPPPPPEEEQPPAEAPEQYDERTGEDEAAETPEIHDQEREKLPEEAGEHDLPEPFNGFHAGADSTLSLRNENLELVFSTQGGNMISARLLNHKDYKGDPVELFNRDTREFGYHFPYQNELINTADLYFEAEGDTGFVDKGAEKTIYMRLPLEDGVELVRKYVLTGEGFKVQYSSSWNGFNQVIPRNVNYIDLIWNSELQQQEVDLDDERLASTVYYKYRESTPTYLSERSTDEEDFTGRVKWFSFKQKFFIQTLIADDYFYRGKVESIFDDEAAHVKTMRAEMVLPFDHNDEERFEFTYFLGPNKYSELYAAGYDLHRQVPLGWFIFRWVNEWLVIPIFNYLGGQFASYGWVIFFLTLFIKLITLPLTYKAYLSMAKMKLLKPDIEELKEKHEGDMQKLQQAQMKLYQKAGVNPLSGCIPMLLQLPILVALFMFFPSSIELRHESFLWANDLSTYDVFYRFAGGFSIPFYGNHVSMFALLMAVSTFFYTMLNNSFSGAQKEMKYVSYFIPFFLLFIFNSFAAGLTYYYFLFNVISIAQQFGFRFMVNEEKLKARIEENKKKPAKKSRFQKKLEDLQKKQEQIQAERENRKKSAGAKKKKKRG